MEIKTEGEMLLDALLAAGVIDQGQHRKALEVYRAVSDRQGMALAEPFMGPVRSG